MHIAINTRFAWYGYQEGYGRFTREVCSRLPGLAPEDAFLYLDDRPHAGRLSDAPNLRQRSIGPPARHPLLWKLWYDLRLPAVLRRERAEVLFSPDGICSLHTSVPQVVAIHDLAFLRDSSYLPAAQYQYYKWHTPRFIRQARRVVTVSACSRDDIHRHYPFAVGKVEVVPNAADPAFRPMGWEERSAFREAHTEGREYFLCVGSVHPRKNLVNLLRAFSVFKRRQRSNMLLLVAGRMAWRNGEFERMLSTFRYRHDVRLLGYVPQERMAGLMASAWALVYPSLWEGFGIPVLEAMQSGVPVVCSGNSSLPEVAADAGLYFDPLQPEDMGRQLSLVFRDEALRARMVARGLELARGYSWDTSARRLLAILREAAGHPPNPYL
jgi:glycosyltransferase involved in cell wall biosynthesis